MQEHPVSEALFNFVNAYSLMLWPLWATDLKSIKVKGKFWWWVGTQVGAPFWSRSGY